METTTKPNDGTISERISRRVGFTAAAAGLYLLAFGSRRLQATPGAEDGFLAKIAASAAALEAQVKGVRDEYNSLAKKANEKLALVEPIKTTIENVQKIDQDIRQKRDEVAAFVNTFHRAQKDPLSFRFPSIDSFTVEIFDRVKKRFKKLQSAINGLVSDGKTGEARTLRLTAKADAQATLQEAGARIQRNELEKLKKATLRNAKDTDDEHLANVMLKAGMPWLFECLQRIDENTAAMNRNIAVLQQVVLGKMMVSDSSMDEKSLNDAISALKEGRGGMIEDKGGSLA